MKWQNPDNIQELAHPIPIWREYDRVNEKASWRKVTKKTLGSRNPYTPPQNHDHDHDHDLDHDLDLDHEHDHDGMKKGTST